ncbi:cysteine synthase B [Enterobacter cloacae]|uniref:Cysteine synthase B n=1 Tax=Enterobacter cloacae TaxID=550 RepID=A0A377LUW6_ENTCL|nr:cysteine synthase B [Enterobacter cloacae]
MGTTGTITGVSRFLREQEKPVAIVGLQPEEGSSIPGIRRWPAEYMPAFLMLSWWIRCWIFISARRKIPCASWRYAKASSAG